LLPELRDAGALAESLVDEGYKVVRIQVAVPGQAAYGSRAGETPPPPLDGEGHFEGRTFEPAAYCRIVPKLFEHVRKELGDDVELLHDMHERYPPNLAVQFAKEAERLHLFFLEDALSPEDIAYFRQIRQNCATPIAMGELFNSPHEWTPLIAERLIDFIRMHVSAAGGLTPMRKAAAFAELHGVRTAWHGPGDVSPIGHMANVTLSIACHNFGVLEYSPFNAATQEVFKGCPVMQNGYLHVNETPGWGIEVDEKLAAADPTIATQRR
jgi:mannonate dehydratase